VYRPVERPAVDGDVLAIGHELGVHDGGADAGLPGEAVDGALGDVARPARVAADQALGDDLAVLDGHALRMAHALLRLVIETNGNVLALDGQALEIDHDRMGKTTDPHRPAGVRDHAETRHLLVRIASGFDGQRAAKRQVFRLPVGLRHPCRPPRRHRR
jgi:hypothetical protein